jgi:hypothetical protein
LRRDRPSALYDKQRFVISASRAPSVAINPALYLGDQIGRGTPCRSMSDQPIESRHARFPAALMGCAWRSGTTPIGNVDS